MEKDIQRYWNNRSNTYSEMINEDMNSFKRLAWSDIIRSKVEGKDRVKALDVGTGPGFFAIIMAQMGFDVTAIDSSEKMLEEARANAKLAGVEINFIKTDGEELGIEEEFDLIISRNVTWTLKEPEKTYKKWYESLKEDGRLVIFDANWYYRLADESLEEEYEKDMEIALKLGYDCKTTKTQEDECEKIAEKLPLTYKFRPDWDRQVLDECGFKKIIIDEDISDAIYTGDEKVAYKTTPMFSICAYK